MENQFSPNDKKLFLLLSNSTNSPWWLVKNTLSIRVGDKIDRNFVAETLNEYDFERTDFVYEAGQYSVRGGILDVFSYAAE